MPSLNNPDDQLPRSGGISPESGAGAGNTSEAAGPRGGTGYEPHLLSAEVTALTSSFSTLNAPQVVLGAAVLPAAAFDLAEPALAGWPPEPTGG